MNRPERLFVSVSAVNLVAWLTLSLLAETGIHSGDTFLFGVMAFPSTLIFGFSYHMMPRFWSRQVDLRLPKYLHLLLAETGLVLTYLRGGSVGPGIWLAGVAVYLVVLSRSRRGRDIEMTVLTSEGRVDRVSIGFALVGLAYLVAGSVLLVKEPSARAVHLFLLGFVLNTIFGYAYRMVAVFLGGKPFLSVTAVQLPLSTVAPGLVAAGVMEPSLLGFGAAAEAVVVLLFLINLVAIFRSSPGRRNPHKFLQTALLFLMLGVGIGAAFPFYPGARAALREVHAWSNLFGFVAMFGFGVSYQTLVSYEKEGNPLNRWRGDLHYGLTVAGLALLLPSKAGLLPPLYGPVGICLLTLGAALWSWGILVVMVRHERLKS